MQFRGSIVTTPEARTVYGYNLLVDQNGKKITYKDMYIDMASALGWPTWKPGHAWFKLLPLAEIGTLCGLRSEPCLSALVREQDRIHIGKGYQTAHFNCHGVSLVGHAVGDDFDCPRCVEGGPHWEIIQKAAKAETQLVRGHTYQHW